MHQMRARYLLAKYKDEDEDKGFAFDLAENKRDVFHQATTDAGCMELAKLLKWDEDLQVLYDKHHKNNDSSESSSSRITQVSSGSADQKDQITRDHSNSKLNVNRDSSSTIDIKTKANSNSNVNSDDLNSEVDVNVQSIDTDNISNITLSTGNTTLRTNGNESDLATLQSGLTQLTVSGTEEDVKS